MPSSRTLFGLEAETAVCRLLEQRGFTIADRNWRQPWGELDIVAEKAGVVHFVEVKASRLDLIGFAPTVRADWRKMTKVERTARSWLAYHRYAPDAEWQMDVASVIMNTNEPRIELFENI